MTEGTFLYIPHDEAEKYHKDGWEVIEMPLPHGHYSFLAYREDDED